jgi:hypothetical protein
MLRQLLALIEMEAVSIIYQDFWCNGDKALIPLGTSLLVNQFNIMCNKLVIHG